MNCLYVSSEAWVNTADTVIELLAVLHQHTELSAEFFLMCLEVCHTVCTLSTGFHLYSVNDKPPWCIFMSLPPILWAVGGIMFSAGLSVHVQRCQPSRFYVTIPPSRVGYTYSRFSQLAPARYHHSLLRLNGSAYKRSDSNNEHAQWT